MISKNFPPMGKFWPNWSTRFATELSNLNQETAGYIKGFESYKNDKSRESIQIQKLIAIPGQPEPMLAWIENYQIKQHYFYKLCPFHKHGIFATLPSLATKGEKISTEV